MPMKKKNGTTTKSKKKACKCSQHLQAGRAYR
ncbi:hypothetical protein GGR21_004221 [Dysgonomonas hofstadii]|uniref:Uncharacterized protein n=1 Tax=Dysgonomonas hofstadii TaxID=637886 RepID=A0A840CUD2_9BACT|nr:hypothetical protein [Dysgonomonas hofstadii]